MKIKLSMFVLPQEIDQYEWIVKQLKINSTYLTDLKVEMDVTLSLSDSLVNWSGSALPKSYFEDKFYSLVDLFDWVENTSLFEASSEDDILGCVSHRRSSWKRMTNDTVAMSILDCDIVFPTYFLYSLEESIRYFVDRGENSWVLTPEIIRIWDSTWDELVHPSYKNHSFDFHKSADVYSIVNDPGLLSETGLREIITPKFSGGWFTTISKNILDTVTIPESFGHYGLEDTFIMACMSSVKEFKQYSMSGIVVCENYRYRDNSYLTKYIKTIDRRDEFLQIANSAFYNEVEDFLRRKVTDG